MSDMSELIVAQNIHTGAFFSDNNLDLEGVIKEAKWGTNDYCWTDRKRGHRQKHSSQSF
jgi:hypothetical protein